MSAQTIPTRIRQNIRDQITSKDAPLTATTSQLSSTLGYSVSFDPEWGMLWTTLHSYYPDQATFVPNVASVVTLWCRAFTTWIEDDSNEEAVERLLDALKNVGTLKLALEISPSSPRPTTTWRPSTRSFVIALPKARPSSSQTVLAGFSSDLLALFTQSPSLLATGSAADDPGSISRASTSALDDPDAWAELTLDSPQTHPVATTRAARAAETMRNTSATAAAAGRGGGALDFVPGDDPLPDVHTLERPEELTQRPPYRLIVRQESRQRVTVECSHQGSLKLLESYLTRWVRSSTDFVNRPPLAEVKLRESVFGLGLLYDTLIVEAGRGRDVNALLVLGVVEGVLGYEGLDGGRGAASGAHVGGGVWEFRRGRGFR